MRFHKIAAVALVGVFGVLSIAHSQSEQMYSSKSAGWGLLIGSCQLKVQTLGSVAVYIPVGNSGSRFESSIPGVANVTKPMELVEYMTRGENQVTEKLKVYFTVQGAGVVPEKYSFSREYSRRDKSGADGGHTTVDKYEVNCLDLKADSI